MHLLCCGRGLPLQVRLSGGQAGEAPQFLRLLELEEKKHSVVVADKGYYSQTIRKALREQSIKAQIPERGLAAESRRRRKGRPPSVSKELYRQRNIIERLKEMRRFAYRFDKPADSYLAFVQLAFVRVCLKPYFQTHPRNAEQSGIILSME
ncbi:transposase [Pontibacter ummariensis]|uniref:transposase n=1 Tax=Pontibacter ummariensis TaxID=1610492 RepID=UPI000B77C45C